MVSVNAAVRLSLTCHYTRGQGEICKPLGFRDAANLDRGSAVAMHHLPGVQTSESIGQTRIARQ